MTSTEPIRTDPPRPVGRLGPIFAAIWLIFLIDPMFRAWQQRTEARGVLALVLLAIFVVVYMWIWWHTRKGWAHFRRHSQGGQAALRLSILGVLAAAIVACVGESGLACLPFIGVSAVMLLSGRRSLSLVLLLIFVTFALSAVEGWGSQVGTAFAVAAASFAMYGVRALMMRNVDLLAAYEENSRLVVDNERSRFARDLHDILGHSLTVITVKAELARRLFDDDPDRARAELEDLERLSRDALADVRRAVEGYRDLTLPGELARARQALQAAEIESRLPNSTEEVPSDRRELFAWTVREGVTNVLRHSRASMCEIVLTPSSAEVRDDGRGPSGELATGSGLNGLRERAAAADATVVTKALEPGFSLKVVAR